MKFIKTNWQKLFLFSYFFLIPLVSSALCVPSAGKICNPLESKSINDIPTFINILLEGALSVGIPVVALAVVYCGFLFVKAQGKPEELKKAKDALLYTLIGAAILLGSWAIANLISATVTGLE